MLKNYFPITVLFIALVIFIIYNSGDIWKQAITDFSPAHFQRGFVFLFKSTNIIFSYSFPFSFFLSFTLFIQALPPFLSSVDKDFAVSSYTNNKNLETTNWYLPPTLLKLVHYKCMCASLHHLVNHVVKTSCNRNAAKCISEKLPVNKLSYKRRVIKSVQLKMICLHKI